MVWWAGLLENEKLSAKTNSMNYSNLSNLFFPYAYWLSVYTCRWQLFPSPMLIPGIKLRSTALWCQVLLPPESSYWPCFKLQTFIFSLVLPVSQERYGVNTIHTFQRIYGWNVLESFLLCLCRMRSCFGVCKPKRVQGHAWIFVDQMSMLDVFHSSLPYFKVGILSEPGTHHFSQAS